MTTTYATAVGRRETNEDRLLVAPELGVFAICDGMGGHEAGEVASGLAVRAIADTCLFMPGHPVEWVMHIAIWRANADIRRKGRTKAHRGMGTTVVALAFGTFDTAVVAWAGDSRCYRLRGRGLEPLTDDHSLVGYLVATAQLRPEDAATYPYRGTLLRSLGAIRNESGDVRRLNVRPDDVYLLCSDGLTDALEDASIAVALHDGAGAQDLVGAALARNLARQDNVSAIVVRM